ncbi:MAG: ABC transporter ATP-binding protein [Solobacterium sp.]|nr:ABC transporter ATP-binding protein [Solobacterium sp.]
MLNIEHLYKSFKDNDVIRDLSIEIPDSSIFGLVGINGAGKSTLLRLIAGVYEPDQGSVCFNDSDTSLFPEIRSSIAFVSDEQYYPAGSTIASVRTLYECMYDFDFDAYRKYLELFGLNEGMNIRTLSKGNRRRVSLVFALSIHPKLLLLDEAYDGLEPLARLHFKKILAEKIEDEGLTVIISSHNLKELEDICDSFGILEDGHIVSYGDLLEARDSVNKYQAAFKEEKTKEDFRDLDLLHFEQEGRVIQLVVRGERDEILKQLEDMDPVLVDVLPVSFEELFIYELESRGDIHE